VWQRAQRSRKISRPAASSAGVNGAADSRWLLAAEPEPQPDRATARQAKAAAARPVSEMPPGASQPRR